MLRRLAPKPYAERGVPMFRVGRGLDLVDGGVEAGETYNEDCTKIRDHRPSDQHSPDGSVSGVAQENELRNKHCAASPGGR